MTANLVIPAIFAAMCAYVYGPHILRAIDRWATREVDRHVAAALLLDEGWDELDAAMEQACALTVPPTMDALVADTAAFRRTAAQIKALPEVAS